jgi:hypothetical protein
VGSPLRAPLPVTLLLAAALLLAGAAALGYRVGTQHAARSHTLVGRVYVGGHQAGVRVGSWGYNIPTTDGALDWFDASGVHDGGTAPCLRTPGRYTWVRFGWARARGPGTLSWRRVTWVRCIRHP